MYAGLYLVSYKLAKERMLDFLKISLPWTVNSSLSSGGLRMGCVLSREDDIVKAKIPPMLVPPITSKILCNG